MADYPDTTQVQDALAEEILQIHEDSYGKGAAEVTVLVNDNAIVVFLDDLELQRNEEFLMNSGQGDSVVQMRGMFQQEIGTTYCAAVERVTGRRVTSFASVTKLDPNYAVEIFRLA